MNSTSQHTTPVKWKLSASCRQIPFGHLTTFLNFLPELRREGEGKLSLPKIGFSGHFSAKENKSRRIHPVLFIFTSNFAKKKQTLRITVNSIFFTLTVSEKEVAIKRLRTHPLMIPIHLGKHAATEAFSYN